MSLDLFVRTTDCFIVDDETAAAEFRQDTCSKFAETFTHVADLTLTFFGVLVHFKHAKNHILVLNIACSNKLFEAIPVLCRVMSVNISTCKFCSLELLVDVFLCSVLALVG